MPTGNWNIEWLNHNSQRRLPLADDATAVDTTESFEVPNDFLVALDLPLSAALNVDPARFFVKQIAAYATGYGVFIGYQPASGSAITVATALIPSQTHTRNFPYRLGGIGDFADTLGTLVVGSLENIDKQPAGSWDFTLEATRFDTFGVRPIIQDVSAIVAVNGDQRSNPLRGDVELAAGTNMQIAISGGIGGSSIVLNAISGEGTITTCDCEGQPTNPILTINGVPPTADGRFTLVGSDCLQIETIDNGIRLIDTCSQPCCGCAELERITQDLERLGMNAKLIESFVTELKANVDSMSLTVLGSRLGDRGCVQCE